MSALDATTALDHLTKFAAAAAFIGAEAKEAADAFQGAFAAHLEFVTTATTTKGKPDDAGVMALLKPVSEKMAAANEIADRRKNSLVLHSKFVNESCQALGWVLQNSTVPAIETALDGAMFHGNKIMREKRGEDAHMNFVKEMQNCLKALAAAVKESFPKGLLWGGAASSAAASSGPTDSTGFDMTETLAAAEKVRAAGAAIGAEAKEAADAFVDALTAQKEFVTAALGRMKPDDAGVMALLKPTSEKMQMVGEIADRRKNSLVLHSKFVNESCQALGWVLQNSTVQVIEAALDAAMFNGNKIMREKRGEEPHMNFVKEMQATLKALAAAVKGSFAKGLLWGANIGAASAAAGCGGDDDDVGGFDLSEAFAAADKMNAAAGTIGAEAKEAADAFVDALKAQKEFVTAALTRAKPDDAGIAALLKPVSEKLQVLGEIADRRKNSLVLHSKFVNEAGQSLGWVLQSSTVPAIEAALDGAMFHGNKIMREKRGEDAHMNFVKEMQNCLKALQAAVKGSFTKGLMWGAHASKGGSSASPARAAPAAAAAPAATAAAATTAVVAKPASNNPLLAALAQATEGGASAHLKHVTDDQKTHKQKNREVKTVEVKKKKQSVHLPPRGPEKSELVGRMWQIENVWSSKEDPLADEQPRIVELKEVDRAQPVSISGCVNTIIKIHGKVNSVQMLNCVQCVLEVQDTVGPVSITNGNRVRIVVNGVCPSVIFDKSEFSQLQLVNQIETEIVTSMTANINVVLPWRDPEVDIMTTREIPVPEQFQSTIQGNKVKSGPTDHSGG